MNIQNYNNFDDSQDVMSTDLLKHEYYSSSLLMPQKLNANQHIEKFDNEIVSIAKTKQCVIPKADILGSEIAEKYRGRWIFNGEVHCWMVYELDNTSGIWSQVNDYYIEGLINTELKNREISGYGHSGYISNIISKVRIELTEIHWVEKSPTELLPFKNCVLEIATGTVLNHSPDYRFTWCLPREFDNSSNEFPLINQWLDEVTNNNDSIKEILLCYLATILKGCAKLQQFLHLIGSAGSGKGTFVRLAQSLVGDNNVCSTTLKDFCGTTFGAANVYKKRLLVFADQTPYHRDVQKFKSLTGQDDLQAEKKYKDAFQFRFDGMVIMISNEPVFDARNSSWLTRRQIVIPFNHTVDKDKLRDLDKEFQPELNALTQYLLTISDDTVTQVLRKATDNPELAQHNLEQQINSNPIAGWIDESVIRDASSKCPIGNDKTEITTLFGSYTQWCRKSGNYTPSSRNFSSELVDFCNSTMRWKDVEKRRTSKGNYIHGLRLRESGKDDNIPSPLAGSVELNLHSEE